MAPTRPGIGPGTIIQRMGEPAAPRVSRMLAAVKKRITPICLEDYSMSQEVPMARPVMRKPPILRAQTASPQTSEYSRDSADSAFVIAFIGAVCLSITELIVVGNAALGLGFVCAFFTMHCGMAGFTLGTVARKRPIAGAMLGASLWAIGLLLIFGLEDHRRLCGLCMGAVPDKAIRCRHCGSEIHG